MGLHTDVFVVGGGPAGLAAAIACRALGFRVTVADGAKPPIMKACGEGLLPDAVAALGELGVALRERDGCVLRGIRFEDDSASVRRQFSCREWHWSSAGNIARKNDRASLRLRRVADVEYAGDGTR